MFSLCIFLILASPLGGTLQPVSLNGFAKLTFNGTVVRRSCRKCLSSITRIRCLPGSMHLFTLYDHAASTSLKATHARTTIAHVMYGKTTRVYDRGYRLPYLCGADDSFTQLPRQIDVAVGCRFGDVPPINKMLALFEKRVKNSPLKNGTSRKECRLPSKSGGMRYRVRCATRHIFLKKKISNFCRSYPRVVVRSLADTRDFLHHVSIFYFIFQSLFGFL